MMMMMMPWTMTMKMEMRMQMKTSVSMMFGAQTFGADAVTGDASGIRSRTPTLGSGMKALGRSQVLTLPSRPRLRLFSPHLGLSLGNPKEAGNLSLRPRTEPWHGIWGFGGSIKSLGDPMQVSIGSAILRVSGSGFRGLRRNFERT